MLKALHIKRMKYEQQTKNAMISHSASQLLLQYRRGGRTKTQSVVNAVSSIITFQFQGWWLKHFCKQWPKPHQLQPIKIIQAAADCLGPVVFVFRVFLHRGDEIVVIHTYLPTYFRCISRGQT